MPPVSEAQRRAMEAAAHGRSTLGIPKKVGEEFVGKDAKGHAAGILFVAPDGDVLTLRRSSGEENFAGHWALPGGGAEDGETPEQTADREAREEIGTVPAGEKKLLDSRMTPNGLAFHTFAQPVAEKFVPTLNDEHSGYAWAPLDQLPEPLHPAMKAMLGERLGIAADMSPEDWTALRSGFAKWTREEEAEPEHAQDAIAFDRASVRRYDTDGHLHVEMTPISKANICPYFGREIPGAEAMGLDPNRQYRLLRDPAELERGAETFAGKPLMIIHTPVSAADHPHEKVAGAIGTTVKFEAPYLRAPLTVWDGEAIELIDTEEQRELSCGYRYRADMTPGTYEGEPYDGVMRDIVGNHVALVKEGRAGPDVMVGDSAIPPSPSITETRIMANAKGLSRQALIASTALQVYLPGKLAADAKLDDIQPLLAGVTSKNWKASQAKIVAGLKGKLASDEHVAGLTAVLLALDEAEEDMPEPATKDKKAKDMKAKDRKGMDRKARDEAREEFKEKLKDKLSAEDWKAACDDIDGMEAEDEETEEEREEREAEDRKAKDEEMKKDGKAMDAAIQTSVAAATKRVREEERGIRAALVDVRPWVGELSASLALDSKDDVYRHAAVTLGVPNAKAVHADALWPIIQAQPKPGAHRSEGHVQIGLDAAAIDEATKIAPGLARIQAV